MMKACEDEPPVESGRALFASAARFNSRGVRDTLDCIAQADFFVSYKAWKAHAVRLLPAAFSRLILAHSTHLTFPSRAPGMRPMR